MKWVTVLLPVPLDSEFTYSVPEGMEDNAVFGRRAVVSFGSREMTGYIVAEHQENPDGEHEIKPLKRVVDKEDVFNRDLLETARWMKGMYLSPVGMNLSMMVPSGRRESEVSPFYETASFRKVEHLTEDQESALLKLRSRKDGIFYLYGVTGSGKSEVFLRRCEDVIREGRQALYLVPEITLTHQLSGEVYERFNGRVAILHSSLTPSQRLKAWKGIMEGTVDLVIGARSSVFAPFRSLGLIVLDEEHEGSYKSGSAPRYHTRQVAQYRAHKLGAQLVMGSATPSLEAWRLMLNHTIESVLMPRRIGEGRFPRIKVVDMKGEKRNISRTLEEEMRLALREGKGVLLFLNRRGFSYGYVCQTCGKPLECPNCTVSLTYHRGKGRLLCHTCGYSMPLTKVCPECSSRDLVAKGFGTENAEEEVRLLFPDKRIERLDTDVASGDKEKVRKTLEEFRSGEIDILLGTQMIAKGLNFPKVSLVGVLNADSTLSLPDFRAGERTFSLLQQVSGRAGRYRDDGIVVIQTSQPTSTAITMAQLGDLENYYRVELQERKETMFPPYSRLVNISFRSKNEEKVRETAEAYEEMAGMLEASFPEVEVFSASPCLIEKMAMQFRWHVLLRCTEIAQLLTFTRTLNAQFKVPSGVHMEIDVDPADLF